MRGKRIKAKLRAGQPVFTTVTQVSRPAPGRDARAERRRPDLPRRRARAHQRGGVRGDGAGRRPPRRAGRHPRAGERAPRDPPLPGHRHLRDHGAPRGHPRRRRARGAGGEVPARGRAELRPGPGGGAPRPDARRVRAALERGNGRLRALRGRGGTGRDRGHLPGSGPRRRGRWRLRPRSLHGPRGGAVAGGRPGRGRARPPDVPPAPHALRDGAARPGRSRAPDRARLPADHGVDPRLGDPGDRARPSPSCQRRAETGGSPAARRGDPADHVSDPSQTV